MSDERRSHSRYAFKIPCHLVVGANEAFFRGYVVNLSVTGAFVIMDEAPALGPNVSVSFHIRPATDCEASGKVVRVMAMGRGQGFGIEFKDWNTGYANFIRNLEASSNVVLMQLIRDMRHVDIRIDDPVLPPAGPVEWGG